MCKFLAEHLWIVGAVLIAGCCFAVLFFHRRMGTYQFAKKHILVYFSLAVLLISYLFFFGGLRHFGFPETYDSLFDNILANYIVVGLVVLFYFVERDMKGRSEDREKLRQDYDALAGKYCKSELVARDGGKYFPVVRLGSCDLCVFRENEYVNLENISIEDSQNAFHLPPVIENHFSALMAAHDTSTVYNNMNVRVTGLEAKDDRLSIRSERTYYYYSLVTNRAADYEWDGMTVRELFEPGPRFCPLENSALSNHLGFNGFVESQDGKIAFVLRGGKVSIGKRTYGTSIGASLKSQYALDESGAFTAKGLVNSILQEISDELKIERESIEDLRLIAAYRDGVECGKPQLLFWAKAKEPAAAIDQNFIAKSAGSKPDVKNLSRKEKKRKLAEYQMLVDGKKLAWLDRENLNRLRYEETGIRFSAETDLPGGGFHHPDGDSGTTLPDQFLPMVPSASASVRLLQEYFDGGQGAGTGIK